MRALNSQNSSFSLQAGSVEWDWVQENGDQSWQLALSVLRRAWLPGVGNKQVQTQLRQGLEALCIYVSVMCTCRPGHGHEHQQAQCVRE